ncbi:response regulator [Paenibacillus sp. S150]|uniref:response regulator transcription factor n=1 Tax=Paenibacillus sp. S150 TaxID=2749826 RepID=UPI001C56C61B|nr:response regulator [Paenibacillus sp. S150]MBW4082278.1 response regulator [Paenibacillus sp. S150]
MHQLLIVDDQTAIADDLAYMLDWQEIGIGTVHKAYSGKEALDLLYEHSIDVVVTDIRMPGMSGLELIAEIRSRWKHIKCILLTGYADFEYTQQALRLHSSNYLLKPVEDEELMEAVRRALGELEQEWQDIASLQKAACTLREQLPKLREYLLLDLLSGKQSTAPGPLGSKLAMYEIGMAYGAACRLLLVRIDDTKDIHNPAGGALIEYALANMTSELFGERMRLWHCMDANGFIVCVLSPGQPSGDGAGGAETEEELNGWIETQAFQLQQAAKSYLQAGISVLTSKGGLFPGELSFMYQSSLAGFRHFIGNDTELFVSLAQAPERGETQALGELYRTPTLGTLLEMGQWEAAEDKVGAIFRELEEDWPDSQEHILETYFSIASSIASLIHRTKKWLADTLGDDFFTVAGGRPLQTVSQLRSWTERVIAAYRHAVSNMDRDSRSSIIRRVQEFITQNLSAASLQTISSSVYLNPSYLSKIYKLETGEGISEYILRIRMEQAKILLSQAPDKIYEISVMLGYQKSSYFIQLFKKHYGMTPQEYRNMLGV